ncbi:MAG TPA: C40 family peptidase [Methylibium sp.]
MSCAQAAPDADPVARFLSEKGLVNNSGSNATAAPASEPGLVQKVRDRASDVASDLVLSAMNFLGVPYKRGGQTEEAGFDCSGFTRHIFEASVGLVLPRRSEEQARAPGLLNVARSELKPGDLVFFNTLRHTFSHVGIYLGDNKFIHAPRSGAEVRIEDMRVAYWSQRFNGARRVPQADAPVDAPPASLSAPALPQAGMVNGVAQSATN